MPFGETNERTIYKEEKKSYVVTVRYVTVKTLKDRVLEPLCFITSALSSVISNIENDYKANPTAGPVLITL